MSGDEEKYLEAGMNAYISKPIVPAELFHAIDKALALGQDLL
jgi:two-component system, sensor histidine kinase and response regulator